MAVAIATVAAADIRAGSGRSHMRACADAMAVKPATCSDGTDMRAGMHTAIADAGAGAHNRSGMAACANAVTVNARTRTDTADMRARAHAMAADMRADADTQDMDICADGISRDGRK